MNAGRLGLDEAALYAERGDDRDRWRRTLRLVGSPEALGLLSDLEQGWDDREAAELARTTLSSFGSCQAALGAIAGHQHRDALFPAIRDGALATGVNPAEVAGALISCMNAYGTA